MVIALDVTDVGVSLVDPTVTIAVARKFDPFIVSVNGVPATAEVGDFEEIVGVTVCPPIATRVVPFKMLPLTSVQPHGSTIIPSPALTSAGDVPPAGPNRLVCAASPGKLTL